MGYSDTYEKLAAAAPAGFYLALHVGFAFPEREINRLPLDWIEFYTSRGLFVHDPVLRWIYANDGAARIEDLKLDDPANVLLLSRRFGLRYGAVVSVEREHSQCLRSYATFYRSERPFERIEISALQEIVKTLHAGLAREPELTAVEVQTLRMLSRGMRVKQIAQAAGITDSAVKARLSGARRKTGTRTTSQLLTIAAARRLI
ncbi:helix-turn-helix transcriptional regulator [Albirhodobacter sp. R86504]|jgi:LuxR family transcriptional regulator|uniref:helix-turn-helix transcriptional regulator n=1 Tax=Albirhodobacter sp. R86504 TaxID=3093848 RepID=UPI00366BC10A